MQHLDQEHCKHYSMSLSPGYLKAASKFGCLILLLISYREGVQVHKQGLQTTQ